MYKTLRGAALFAVMAVLLLAAQPVFAAKEFVEHKIILQISDPNPFKQTLVLNVANNLVKEYGPDKVDIQIIAFGPGVRLLFADNANKGRIKSLVDIAGVEFHACSNTMKNMGKKLGYAPVINKLASTDSPGVVRIVKLIKEGYTLIKP